MRNDEPTALQATYSDLKIIKTRGAFQLIQYIVMRVFGMLTNSPVLLPEMIRVLQPAYTPGRPDVIAATICDGS